MPNKCTGMQHYCCYSRWIGEGGPLQPPVIAEKCAPYTAHACIDLAILQAPEPVRLSARVQNLESSQARSAYDLRVPCRPSPRSAGWRD